MSSMYKWCINYTNVVESNYSWIMPMHYQYTPEKHACTYTVHKIMKFHIHFFVFPMVTVPPVELCIFMLQSYGFVSVS